MSPASRVDARISGEISGQVAVGNHIIQNNVDHGGIVYIAAPGEQATPRPRPTPVYLRGRSIRALLGRNDELEGAAAAIESNTPLEFYGVGGVGKTTLLKYLAHHPPPPLQWEGVVYHQVLDEPVADSLQFLFEAFYESDVPFKPTHAQICHYFERTRALILLDDVPVGPEELARLMDALPNSSFVLASSERHLWGEGRAVHLAGLPHEEALALLERELGRTLEAGERAEAESICSQLDCHPLRLLQVAGLVRDRGDTLRDVAERLRAGSAGDALRDGVLESMSEDERKVVSTLGSLGQANLGSEHLPVLSGLSDPDPVIQALLRRGILQSHSPRYSVALDVDGADTADRSSPTTLLSHFQGWLEEHRDEPEVVLQEAEPILKVLELTSAAKAWPEVLRLGRAFEGALLISGRWGRWEAVLRRELEAARATSDRPAEAWCLHQLGSRALCLEETSVARELLAEALKMREEVGDHSGAAATRHNLEVLSGPPPSQQARESSTPPPRNWRLPIVAAVLLLVLGGAAWLFGRDSSRRAGTRGETVNAAIQPQALDFGGQRVGTTSSPRSVTVTNRGSAEIGIEDSLIIGSNRDDFQLNDGCRRSVLLPSAACALEVSFSPTGRGSRTASLSVNNASGKALTVRLRGVGLRRGAVRGKRYKKTANPISPSEREPPRDGEEDRNHRLAPEPFPPRLDPPDNPVPPVGPPPIPPPPYVGAARVEAAGTRIIGRGAGDVGLRGGGAVERELAGGGERDDRRSGLPVTGAHLTMVLGLGLGAVALGGALVRASRRRRATHLMRARERDGVRSREEKT